MINILKHKKIFLIISGLMVFLSALSIAIFGFNLSVDFKGGMVYEIQYIDKIPSVEKVSSFVEKSGLEQAVVQKVGTDSFVIKTTELSLGEKNILDEKLTLNNLYVYEEKRIKSIGPSISSELATKAIFAIIFVTIVIVFFIAYVFRKVSRPVSSFRFGLVAIIALLHDIIIPIGIFALLGFFFLSYQIDVLFVTALLAILGYSVNDTIVIFDRIRENLKNEKKPEKIKGEVFEKIVNKSLNQTLTRSINTSITTLIVLLFLYFIGGETTQAFSLVLIIGVLVGTYSSIFLASPLLVLVEKYQKEPKKEEKHDTDV